MLQDWRYYTAIENCEVCQEVKSLEKFLFFDIPISWAGGELIAATWKGLGVSKVIGGLGGNITKTGINKSSTAILRNGYYEVRSKWI